MLGEEGGMGSNGLMGTVSLLQEEKGSGDA